MVEPRGSEIFPDRLNGAQEDFRDAILTSDLKIRSVRRGEGPQIQQAEVLNSRASIRPGLRVGNEFLGRLMQVLTETLIVAKQECFILSDRASGRTPELVSLKRRSGTHVEVVRCVEGIVAKILKDRAVPLICAGLSND